MEYDWRVFGHLYLLLSRGKETAFKVFGIRDSDIKLDVDEETLENLKQVFPDYSEQLSQQLTLDLLCSLFVDAKSSVLIQRCASECEKSRYILRVSHCDLYVKFTCVSRTLGHELVVKNLVVRAWRHEDIVKTCVKTQVFEIFPALLLQWCLYCAVCHGLPSAIDAFEISEKSIQMKLEEAHNLRAISVIPNDPVITTSHRRSTYDLHFILSHVTPDVVVQHDKLYLFGEQVELVVSQWTPNGMAYFCVR